ncbi:hypothetical protein H4W79_002470 [Nocardiopsis terrae]|uniref:Cupin type-2 domain-containing protein n=1 Tax=Nocardiopsis terrae TaxID=372655 RepID=A0ABR9HGU9_9ACTN|nr:hypothetical protein [Nocardiopsis terrae]
MKQEPADAARLWESPGGSPRGGRQEWLYVLNGRLRCVLGEHDLVLVPGEAAEIDTRLPHWFGAARDEAVEMLSLFGRQGERAHLRARPTRRQSPREDAQGPGRDP